METEEAGKFAQDLFHHLKEICPVFWNLPSGNQERVYTSSYDAVIGKCIMRIWYETNYIWELKLRRQSMKFIQSKANFENYLKETAHLVISCSDSIYEQIFRFTATLLEVISFLYRRGMTDFLYLAPRSWLIMFRCVNFDEFLKVGGWSSLKIAARKLAQDYDKNEVHLREAYFSESYEVLQPSRSLKSVEVSKMSGDPTEVSSSKLTRTFTTESNAEHSGAGKRVSSSQLARVRPIDKRAKLYDTGRDIAKDAELNATADLIPKQTIPKAIDNPLDDLACGPKSTSDVSRTEEKPTTGSIVVEKYSEQPAAKSTNLEKTGVCETQAEEESSNERNTLSRDGSADESLKETFDQKSTSGMSSEMNDVKKERSMEVKKDCLPQQSFGKVKSPEKILNVNVDQKKTLTLEINLASTAKPDIEVKVSPRDEDIAMGSQADQKEFSKEIDDSAKLKEAVNKDVEDTSSTSDEKADNTPNVYIGNLEERKAISDASETPQNVHTDEKVTQNIKKKSSQTDFKAEQQKKEIPEEIVDKAQQLTGVSGIDGAKTGAVCKEPAKVKDSSVRQTNKDGAKQIAHSSEKLKKTKKLLDSKTLKTDQPPASGKTKSANTTQMSSRTTPSGKDQTNKSTTPKSKASASHFLIHTAKSPTDYELNLKSKSTGNGRRLSLSKDLPEVSKPRRASLEKGKVSTTNPPPKSHEKKMQPPTSKALPSSEHGPTSDKPSLLSSSNSATGSLESSAVSKKTKRHASKESDTKLSSGLSKEKAKPPSADRGRPKPGRSPSKNVVDPKSEKPRWK